MRSTIGAGDSTVSGIIAAEGKNPDERLRIAIAVSYSSAACPIEGTKPPNVEDIKRIYGEVKVIEVTPE